jgi:hypothetical protein
VLERVNDIMKKVWDTAKRLYKVLKPVIDLLPGMNLLRNPFAGGLIPGINIPGVPFLADGGIVTRPTLSVIGEAGAEAVIPLNQLGEMGPRSSVTNVTINVANGDPRAVVDALVRWSRQNGVLPAPIRVA